MFENDKQLVDALIARDNAAWKYVLYEVVKPLVLGNVKGMRDILSRHSLSVDAVGGKLFENLTQRDCLALRNFQFKCSFNSFLYWRIYDAVQGLVRETNGSIDMVFDEEETGLIEAIPDKTSDNSELADAMSKTNEILEQLWNEKPSYAIIMLLRNDIGFSSKEIGALTGMSGANIDAINSRAKKAMQKLWKSSGLASL